MKKTIKQLEITRIITSGETSGVCEVARKYAENNKLDLLVKFANNEKYAAGKYEHRCVSILQESEFVLFIHDGVSKGTQNEIKMAKKMGKTIFYNKIDLLDEDEYSFNLDINWNGIR